MANEHKLVLVFVALDGVWGNNKTELKLPMVVC
jgi:hypothetical protein